MSDFQVKKVLRKILEEKGITQKKLCDTVGITPNGLQHIFNKNDLKVSTLVQIASFLQVPIQVFFDESAKANHAASANTEQTELLKQLLASKDETIEQLKLRIQELKGESNAT